MKRLLNFFIGLLTMIAMFAMLCLVAVIYDTGDRSTVQAYFFRGRSDIGAPRSLSEIGERKVRDWLIQKFVTEYLYIIPDTDNINARINGTGTTLRLMSTSNVFDYWARTVAPKMRDLAANGVRRTVTVFDEILTSDSNDYLRVDYELKTWYKPNDMTEMPEITRGTMYLELVDTPVRLRSDIEGVRDWLVRRRDPSVVFSFRVQNVFMDGK